MFGQDRSQLRRFFQSCWNKKITGEPLEPLEQVIVSVINQHPEYQSLIKEEQALDRNYNIDDGQTNPYLHMGMHISLAEQLTSDRPAGIRALHHQLTIKTGDAHQAEHQMMDCLGEILWAAQGSHQPPDENAYLACIKRLL